MPKLATMASVEPCYFLALPPELRIRMYEYVYQDLEFEVRVSMSGVAYTHEVDFEDDECHPLPKGARPLSLLSTCQTVLQEARPVMWASMNVWIGLYNLVDIQDQEQLSKYDALRPIGRIRDCLFLRNIRNVYMNVSIKSAHFNGPVAISELAQGVRELVERLGTATKGKLAVRELELYSQYDEAGLAGVDALAGLRSSCPVRVGVSSCILGNRSQTMGRCTGEGFLSHLSREEETKKLFEVRSVRRLVRRLHGRLVPVMGGMLRQYVDFGYQGESAGESDDGDTAGEEGDGLRP